MAAPMQLSRQLLSRVFWLNRTLSNSPSASHCLLRTCGVRFLHQGRSHIFKWPLPTDVFKRNFQTGQTCCFSSGSDERTSGAAMDGHGGFTDIKLDKKADKSDQLSARSADHRTPPVSPQHSDMKRGDIKIGTESLYDLLSDSGEIEASQKRQQENPDFYRRRIQSEWDSAKPFLAYQDSDPHNRDTHTQNSHSDHRDPSYIYGIGSLVCCAILAFALFARKEQKDTIELLIAKSWSADRNGNLAEAEELLHKALRMAQDTNDQDAITYIFDQLANLAMMHGNLTKAEGLFKETLRRMISSGTAQDDSTVIEISLKLARMYDRMRRYDEAEQGFQWCITTTEKQLDQASDKDTDKDTRQNLQSLLGMCLDCYARHLASHGRLQQAKETYKRALEICDNELKVDGISHPQTVILLNDLGTVYDLGGNYIKAIEYIEKAVDLAERRSPHDLPSVLCNLASVKMHADRFEEAKSDYTRALSLAKKQGDAAVIMEIKKNIAQLETNIFLKDQKQHRQGNQKPGTQKS